MASLTLTKSISLAMCIYVKSTMKLIKSAFPSFCLKIFSMVYPPYYYFLLITIFLSKLNVNANNESSWHDSKKHTYEVVNVGLILDFHSSVGVVAESCIAMAHSDFYAAHPHYATRLVFHSKISRDVLAAVSDALELITRAQVQAIIGPQNSNEARFVGEVGGKAHVPILSFVTTGSPYHSPAETPYLIRMVPSETFQLKAIVAIIQEFGWLEVVLIYEDTEYGNNFIPYLTDALQEVDIQVPYMSAIPLNAPDSLITTKLKKLMTLQTRVFLVHTTSSFLGSRLFSLAEKVGMMSQGYAWIITDGLSNLLNSMDANTMESMEGVLAVRPYFPKSENVENLKMRLGKNFNIFGLWAYDTVWALAMSVEKIQGENSRIFLKNNYTINYDEVQEDSCGIRNLGVSEAGPKLLDEILQTRFQGLSGEFKLENRQLETPSYEIINILGNGERSVGFWSQNKGIRRKLGSSGATDETSAQKLKKIIWPGDSTVKPKGWDIPRTGLKLRVGVPKKPGFTEFVNVQEIGDSKKYIVTGFSVDVFEAALLALQLGIEAEFIPFVNGSGESAGSYDELVDQCSKAYDAVVGDVTIRANRTLSADFSLPYSESGVVMIVKVEPDTLKNMWIFVKPLSWDLWLAICGSLIFVGLVLQILERRVQHQWTFGMFLWFPIAALVFPERNMVANNWAKFVLVLWLFTAYILMQSYTANLSSMLTVDQLTPAIDTPDCAGYQVGSFVKEMLLINFNFNDSKLHPYSTMRQYDDALSKGCKNGGVDAIYDEIPYLKLFLHKYGSKYKMVGTTYNTGGFGFAFPSGSRLARYISMAILDVMENGTIQGIEKKYFGRRYQSQLYEVGEISKNRSLTAYSFVGLFTIIIFLTILALVCSECYHIPRVQNVDGDRNDNDDDDDDNNDENEDIALECDQQVEEEHNNDNNSGDVVIREAETN